MIQPQFRYASDFSEGVASAATFDKFLFVWEGYRKTGYIDHDAKWVIKPQYLEANDFHNGLARVIAPSFLTFVSEYIDKKGKVIAKGPVD